jgi:hypothetical protein
VPVFDNESRKLLVDLATKRGRELCGGAPKGVVEDNGAKGPIRLVSCVLACKDKYLSRQL